MHWHLLVFHDKDKKQFKTQQDPTKWMSLYVHVHLLNAFNWIMHNDSLCSHSFIINGFINGNSDASLQSWLQTVLYENVRVFLTVVVYNLSFHVKNIHYVLYVLFLKYSEKNNIQVSWTYSRMLGVTFKNNASLLLHKRQLFARVYKLSCIIIMCVDAMFIEEVLG